jgi:large repetitive protein
MLFLNSAAFRRLRLGALSIVFAFLIAACGQVGVSGGGDSPLSGVASTGTGSSPGSSDSGPVISGSPAPNVVVGQTYTFTPTATDASSNTLTFSVVNLPTWASFDATSGTLTGAPTAANVGVFANIQISVSDGVSSAALPAFSIAVLAPLTISGAPPAGAVVGSPYSFQPTTNALPTTTLTFSVQNQPSWANFDTTSGQLSGTPTQAGTFGNIIISVSDGVQTAALPAFTITVATPSPGNNPPTISGTPANGVTVGSVYAFTPSASDPAGLTLTFSIANMPSWASFNPADGALSGTPTAANVGTYSNIVISVSDGNLSASLAPFSIKVVAGLTLSGTPASQATAGHAYSFQPTTNAPSGTTLTFTIQNRPAWATFSAATGMLSGTPTSSQAGTYSNIVISATDGVQTASLAPFSITVTAPLTISGNPATSVAAGKAYAFQPTTNAPSGTALTFTIQNKPSWASFNTSTGALTGSPSSSQVGTYSNVAISVSNGSQTASLAAFTITVTSASSGLQISGNPPTAVTAGSGYSFTPTVSDSSTGVTLTFSISNKPSWASFNAATGSLTGTPTTAQVGSYSGIAISVSDGTNSASLPTFSINVTEIANGTATLSWTPVTTNTNGSALTDLAGYKIYYGTSSSALSNFVVLSNPSLTTYTLSNLSTGTWYFGIIAYASDGTQSALSNIGSKTIQ